MIKPPKRPRNLNQIAKLMVDIATDNFEEQKRRLNLKG
tara:strand:- start:3211 stop:3324 length:114 start_codon:yes stop_codon:yes gene_type:complete